MPFVRENYSKYEFRIPMRDGVKLFTSVYVPKDVSGEGKTYPIMLTRTPYSVRPYGVDQYRGDLGPSELFARDKFIFVYQDVRGRYMSEGDFSIVRPYKPVKKGPQHIDESSYAYDSIDWLIKNIPGNTGKVGIWGISQPGFFASAAMIDAHPALVAVSPQAPVTDYYLGDDSYHNGAFMLAHRFSFYQRQPYWLLNVNNTTYNDVWQSRAIWKYLKGIKPAVMLVGGWFDAEDLQGPLRQFEFMRKNSPATADLIVMGPWTHGGFARGDGERVGNVSFGNRLGFRCETD